MQHKVVRVKQNVERDEKIIKLYKQGWSTNKIAERMAVTTGVVAGVFERYKLEHGRRPIRGIEAKLPAKKSSGSTIRPNIVWSTPRKVITNGPMAKATKSQLREILRQAVLNTARMDQDDS